MSVPVVSAAPPGDMPSTNSVPNQRISFTKQLRVLAFKNYKVKKAQTCFCCTCPFIPLLFECLLPIALTLLMTWVSGLVEHNAVPEGFTSTPDFSGGSARNSLSSYWHEPVSYNDVNSGANLGQGMTAGVVPLEEYMFRVDTGQQAVYQRPRNVYGMVCNKIALVPGARATRADVVTFQQWVHANWYSGRTNGCVDEARAYWQANGSYARQGLEVVCSKANLTFPELGYIHVPGFANVTTVFDSLGQFDTYVTGESYLMQRQRYGLKRRHAFVDVLRGKKGEEEEEETESSASPTPAPPTPPPTPVPTTPCALCDSFDKCKPNIAAAIVFDRVGPGAAQGAWEYRIRMNVTEGEVRARGGRGRSSLRRARGLGAISTKSMETNDQNRFLDNTAAGSYALNGFMALQQLVDRYIVRQPVDPGFDWADDDAFNTPAALKADKKRLDLIYSRWAQLTGHGSIADSFTYPHDPLYTKPVAGMQHLVSLCSQAFASLSSSDNTTKAKGERQWQACRPWLQDFTKAERYKPGRVRLVPFPIRGFVYNSFYDIIEEVWSWYFVVFISLTIFLTPSAIITEKETRMREMLKILGVSNSSLLASWYLMYGVLYGALSLVLALIMSMGLFPRSSIFIMFIFFWFFFLTILAWAMALAPFFQKARSGALGIWFLFFISYNVKEADPGDYASRTTMCLLPTNALHFGVMQLSYYESANIGVTLSNAGDFANELQFSSILGMLFFDILLYTFLGWYFDQVLRQEYGTRQPPHFLFLASYWRRNCRSLWPSSAQISPRDVAPAVQGVNAAMQDGDNASADDNFEPVSMELRSQRRSDRCVSIERLHKRFNTSSGVVNAVENLSVDMYEGQIFCLLGHNGAGKTTTISMLTGMIEPSGGDAFIAGRSVRREMSTIRHSLTMCPQHNVLYPNLTVNDHLVIFGQLKGLFGARLEAACQERLASVGLIEKRNVAVKMLSGGMKRKLSVAISLLSASKITFLDEPTSGMDPYSRRSTWDVIRRAREGRVLLLTTHFMEEADLLGDRIAIMADGQLRCCGSSLFLKNRFGEGYQLVIVVRNGCDRNAVCALVQKQTPSAKQTSSAGAEIAFQLPSACSAEFPSLLRALDQQGRAIGVDDFGISVTTMEEVFIKIARGTHYATQGANTKKAQQQGPDYVAVPLQTDPKVIGPSDGSAFGSARASGERLKGAKLQLNHFRALFTKRFHYSRRDRSMMACMTICPGLLLNFGMMIMVLTNVLTMPPPVQLSVFDYNGVSDDSTVTVPIVSPADGKAPIPEQAGVSPLVMGKARLTEWNAAVEPLAAERTVIFPPPSSEMPRFSNGGDNSKDTAPGVWLRYEWGMGAGIVERENMASPSERVTNLTVPSTGPTATTAQGWLKSNCKSQCFVGCNYSLFQAYGECGKIQGASGMPAISCSVSGEAGGYPNRCDQIRYLERGQMCDPLGRNQTGLRLVDNGEWPQKGAYRWFSGGAKYFPRINQPQDLYDRSVGPVAYSDLYAPFNEQFNFGAGSLWQGPALPSCPVARPFPQHNPMSPRFDALAPEILATLRKLAVDSGANADGSYARAESLYGALVVEGRNDTVSGGDLVILHNTTKRDAPAAFFNLHSNMLLRAQKSQATITTHNHPLPLTDRMKVERTQGLAFSMSLFAIMAFASIPAVVIAFVVRERDAAHNAKHQQLLAGASVPMYWLGTYVFDLFAYLVPFVVAVVSFAAWDVEVFTEDTIEGRADEKPFPALVHLFVAYGFAVIPFTYVISNFFRTSSTAQSMSIAISILTGFILMIAAFVMQLLDSTKCINSKLLDFYAVFPPFNLGWGLYTISIMRFFPKTDPCDETWECQRNLQPLNNETREDCFYGLYDKQLMGRPLTALWAWGLAYLVIAVVVDLLRSVPRIRELFKCKCSPPNDALAYTDDEDVAAEAERVASGQAEGDAVVLKELQKLYGLGVNNMCINSSMKVAVKKLSFGIPRGECFGFLGINGAGKTSTMKMLTGDVIPTRGSATLAGYDISTEQLQLRSHLGYCPQFDALLDRLTVREHIELFARIKGIAPADEELVVSAMLQEMDLVQFEHKLAGQLSGGNKRKLSVAIAMIGSPPIVFLDEPSTGMDPVARRFMWEIIAKISTRSNDSAVMLTTHSMEECEALCSRVGIMVGGRLRCLGTVQHLKSKFGQGLMAEVQLMPISSADAAAFAQQAGLSVDSCLTHAEMAQKCAMLGDANRMALLQSMDDTAWTINALLQQDGTITAVMFATWWLQEERVRPVCAFFNQHFTGAQLVERQGSKLRFRLPVAVMPVSDAFELMQSNKDRLGVQEYSLSQTTLEQIFNQFAAQQEEETGGAVGILNTGVLGGSGAADAGAGAADAVAAPAQVMVTVPEGWSVGQQLAVNTPDGQVLNVDVPKGLGAGAQITVSVPPAQQPAAASAVALNANGPLRVV